MFNFQNTQLSLGLLRFPQNISLTLNVLRRSTQDLANVATFYYVCIPQTQEFSQVLGK